jgi:hypothetical protein
MSKNLSPQKAEKVEVAKEVIWFITNNYSQSLYETKLWKLMFFVDSDYFEKHGESITGLDYFKNDHGPTPAYNIVAEAIESLEEEGYITRDKKERYHSVEDYEIEHLNETQLDAARATCEKYYKLTTDQICTLAHRDPIYLSAKEKGESLDLGFAVYRDKEDQPSEGNEFEEIDFSEEQQQNLLKQLGR